ncbi:hypothetical protein D9M72_638610 [compost metagenome]
MSVSCGNVGRLISVDQYFSLTINDLRHATDNDPVLASMVMHLQGERRSGFYFNTLYFKTRASLKHGIGAPRAMDFTM